MAEIFTKKGPSIRFWNVPESVTSQDYITATELHQTISYNMIGQMPSNEALSLAGYNTKKGASIRSGKIASNNPNGGKGGNSMEENLSSGAIPGGGKSSGRT